VAQSPINTHTRPQSQDQIISPIRPRYFVQAGAFGEQGNAQRFSQLLSGLSDTDVVNTGGLYKVRLGPVKSEAEAQQLLAAVESRSRSNALIIKE
jgi:cell division protein FtsN